MKSLMTAIAALFVLQTTAHAALNSYLTVEGTKQGKFKGEINKPQHKDKIEALTFSYSVVSPRDPQSGLPTGRRMHKPFVITKELDSSSPQFFQALVSNEVLKTVFLEFTDIPKPGTSPGNGQEEVIYTIKLTNASVASIEQATVQGTKSNPMSPQEQISFTFQKIEVESKTGKTMAADDWNSNR